MGGCSSESRIETLAAPLCLSRAPPSAGVEFAPDELPLVPSLCRPEWSLGSQNEPEGMSRLVAYGREEEALSPEVGEMPRTLAGIARFQAEDVEAIGLYRSSDRTRDAVEARLLLTGLCWRGASTLRYGTTGCSFSDGCNTCAPGRCSSCQKQDSQI